MRNKDAKLFYRHYHSILTSKIQGKNVATEQKQEAIVREVFYV